MSGPRQGQDLGKAGGTRKSMGNSWISQSPLFLSWAYEVTLQTPVNCRKWYPESVTAKSRCSRCDNEKMDRKHVLNRCFKSKDRLIMEGHNSNEQLKEVAVEEISLKQKESHPALGVFRLCGQTKHARRKRRFSLSICEMESPMHPKRSK
jgi:hypothetical protein